jgi:K+-sensing histidine kinase KdpD
MADRAPSLRPLGAFVGGAALAVAIAVALHPFDSLPDAVAALALVLPVLVGAVIGGRLAAVGVAVVAAAAFSFEFIYPQGSFLIHTIEGFLALAVFLAVAIVVGTLVAVEAERRRHAEEQRDEIERMHEQFKQLTAERERLAEEARRVEVLEEIDRQRAALLRSVSHDLRSPLVTIRGVSSDLRDGTVFDEATRFRLLDLVVSESERLDRIVGNLLSLSRIEAGAFQPDREPVEVDEMVERSLSRLDRLFGAGAIHIDVPAGLPLVDVDPTQIDQVIANILENAARHNPAGTEVTVAATAGTDSSTVRLTIEDDGPGIDPNLRDRLATPFVTSGRGASTGIGLTICKAIVEAHGGTLTIDGEPGLGTRVSFTLPVAG